MTSHKLIATSFEQKQVAQSPQNKGPILTCQTLFNLALFLLASLPSFFSYFYPSTSTQENTYPTPIQQASQLALSFLVLQFFLQKASSLATTPEPTSDEHIEIIDKDPRQPQIKAPIDLPVHDASHHPHIASHSLQAPEILLGAEHKGNPSQTKPSQVQIISVSPPPASSQEIKPKPKKGPTVPKPFALSTTTRAERRKKDPNHDQAETHVLLPLRKAPEPPKNLSLEEQRERGRKAMETATAYLNKVLPQKPTPLPDVAELRGRTRFLFDSAQKYLNALNSISPSKQNTDALKHSLTQTLQPILDLDYNKDTSSPKVFNLFVDIFNAIMEVSFTLEDEELTEQNLLIHLSPNITTVSHSDWDRCFKFISSMSSAFILEEHCLTAFAIANHSLHLFSS